MYYNSKVLILLGTLLNDVLRCFYGGFFIVIEHDILVDQLQILIMKQSKYLFASQISIFMKQVKYL
jgi:hypothetical protein